MPNEPMIQYSEYEKQTERIAELEEAIKYATEYGEVAFLGVNMPFRAFKRLKEALEKGNDD